MPVEKYATVIKGNSNVIKGYKIGFAAQPPEQCWCHVPGRFVKQAMQFKCHRLGRKERSAKHPAHPFR